MDVIILTREPFLSVKGREGLFCRWCELFESVGLSPCVHCGTDLSKWIEK